MHRRHEDGRQGCGRDSFVRVPLAHRRLFTIWLLTAVIAMLQPATMSSTTDPPRARVSTDSAGSAPALRKSLDDDEEKQQQHGDEQAERRGARPEGDDDAPGAAAAAAAAGDDDAGSGAAARQPRWAEAQAGEELQAEESFACEDELETASRARAPAEGASEPAAAASTASAADMATTVVDDKESEEREGGTERAPRARARTKRTPSLLSPFEASQTRICTSCLSPFLPLLAARLGAES